MKFSFSQFFRHFFIVIVLCVLPLISPTLVLAQSSVDLGIGQIDTPPGVDKYQAAAQAQGADIGIIYFMSNMIKLFSIIAGIWVLFNGTIAGYYFIQSSGDASAYEKAKNQLTLSAMGLGMIVLSYTFTGLVGLIFFGDASIFLNPKIQ